MLTTLSLGDRVRNRVTGRCGTVLGHGHQMLNNMYVPTLRVLNEDCTEGCKIEEDFSNNWMLLEDAEAEDRELQYSA